MAQIYDEHFYADEQGRAWVRINFAEHYPLGNAQEQMKAQLGQSRRFWTIEEVREYVQSKQHDEDEFEFNYRTWCD